MNPGEIVSPPAVGARATAAGSGCEVLLLGPALTAVSGVATHLNQLLASPLAAHFRLRHFQVGSEGRAESRAGLVLRMITSPFSLAACLLWWRPRIVHVNTSFEPKGYWRDLVYLAVAKALRRKVVYQIHGGALPGQFFARSRVLTTLLRRALSWPDVVVLLVQSEVAAYHAFAPRARLVRIANAVAIHDADLRAERYRADRPLQVVYLGRLAANKGIFESIEAVRILRDRGVEVRLALVGDGSAASAARAAIAAAGLGERVTVLAPVFGSAKQLLWQGADVLAFPSHAEGLPFSLLEAMSAGAVPVVSPVGAIPDVVQHEVHGLLVPARNPPALADALERLARDRALLHRLAVAARARVVQHFSVVRQAEEFASIYASLLK